MPKRSISNAGPAARLPWLAAFAVLLAAIALTALARPAAAAPVSPELPTVAVLALDEWEEEEEGEEEGADEEVLADEEEEDDEGDEDEGRPSPPEECLLRSARSRLLAYPGPGTVKLTVNYTSFAPVEVAVNYRLTGKRGSLDLGRARKRLGRHGVLRLITHLDESRMERVLGARSFTVDFEIAAAPRSCRRFYTRRLTIRRGGRNQMAWLQSGSPFGIG